jgi:hypothetical protein
MRIWWKCDKYRNYKRGCNSKVTKISPGSNEKQSIEINTTPYRGGDVYLASINTQSGHDVWLIDLGAYFHMTPHREWLYEYERYKGGDVFLGEKSTTKIVGWGRVRLILQRLFLVDKVHL